MNYAHFVPIAPDRGLPNDLSPTIKSEVAGITSDEGWSISAAEAQALLLGAGLHNPTWISWKEIQAINLDEEAAEPDARLTRYKRAENGDLIYDGKSLWDKAFGQAAGIDVQTVLQDTPRWQEGQTWETAEYVFRAERLTRRDALGSNWRLLFRLMESLGERYGDENVRLVAWFSS